MGQSIFNFCCLLNFVMKWTDSYPPVTIGAYENYFVSLRPNYFILANTETANLNPYSRLNGLLFIFCVTYTCTCPVSCKKGRNWCISGWKMFVFLFCSCLMLTLKTMYVYIIIEELGAWTPHVWTYAYFSILAKIAWIFVCDLWFSRQTLPCIFFRHFSLTFREITHAKHRVGVL